MTGIEQQADQAAARGEFAAARDLLRQVVSGDGASFVARFKLSAMLRATGDNAGALGAIEAALVIEPLDFAALLTRAMLLDQMGRSDEAGQAFGRALAQAPDQPPPQMAAVLATAQDRYGAWQAGQADLLRAAAAAAGPITPALDRFITNTVRLTERDRDGPTHYCYPSLPEIAFYDRARFPWLASLEAAADVIQAEFEAVVAQSAAELVPYIQYPDNVPLDQWRTLNRNRDWTAIHLIERGQIVAANAMHCPETMALLSDIPQPDIRGAGPNAMFSLLAPGTHIPPHTGIANTRLVCHFPLIVPEGCWFRVGDDRREWARGAAWVFDDTVEHEAMNPSNALRVILIVDVWHPDLDEAARRGVAAVIGAGGQVHGL
jgi:aspartyl/asparaginyl beta-hydroxylase (cupin superfamily)